MTATRVGTRYKYVHATAILSLRDEDCIECMSIPAIGNAKIKH